MIERPLVPEFPATKTQRVPSSNFTGMTYVYVLLGVTNACYPFGGT